MRNSRTERDREIQELTRTLAEGFERLRILVQEEAEDEEGTPTVEPTVAPPAAAPPAVAPPAVRPNRLLARPEAGPGAVRGQHIRDFQVGQRVRIRNYPGPRVNPVGTVESIGTVFVTVRTLSGHSKRRVADNLDILGVFP
jgi:hypothetical protein